MTRTQRALARRWRPLLLACVLIALSGAVLIIWARITAEADRGDQLAAEADRRGTAVSTLAGDVRRLRAQVRDAGETPAAPDPSDAVPDLPDLLRDSICHRGSDRAGLTNASISARNSRAGAADPLGAAARAW